MTEGAPLPPSSQPHFQLAALLLAVPHSQVTNPPLPEETAQSWGQPVPCPWLQDHQASDVSGIAAGFALPCPPKKSTTQDPLTALYIPPAVRFSRRHKSCLYYQDFLRHTVPSLKGPFSQTIEKTGIKFPKYPSF